MCAGRGGDDDGLHQWVGQHGVEVGGGLQAPGERPEIGLGGAAAHGVAQFGAVLQIGQALEVRLRARAQADEGDADARHAGAP